MELSSKILSDLVVFMKYSRHLPEQGRRETWDEIVTRNKEMHIKKYPAMEVEIEEAYRMVYAKKVLPSMRSLQFGGKPIEISPNRLFNCCFCAMNSWEAFAEIMFLLLGGSGVGISVQKHHVEDLPVVRKPLERTRRYLVDDSITGWADAIKVLMKAYFFGKSDPQFDFSDIRPKGTRLVTSGGKAPGPQPLKDGIHNLRKVLDAKASGSKLTPLEVHDMVCYISDAVLSGGIRRAALISLFSLDDEEMLTCKTGAWWEQNPQRARANNSVVLLRHRISKENFFDLWEKIEMFGTGEPGWLFTNDAETLTNPCFSGDTLIATGDGRGAVPVKQLAEEKKDVPVYSLDIKTGKVNIQMGRNPRITGKKRQIVEVVFDGGKNLKVTPEHEFLLKDGSTKKAIDLEPGDSLPRFVKRLEKISKNNKKEYLRVYCDVNDSKRDKIFEHRLISKFYNKKPWDKFFDKEKKNGWMNGGLVVHHKDYNSTNNKQENLQILTFKEHCKLHASIDTQGEKNGRYCGKTNKDIEKIALKLTKKLGRRFSLKEYIEAAKENKIPQTFTSWRSRGWFKTPKELSLWAAIKCGINKETIKLNPKIARIYLEALEAGYEAQIKNKSVVVLKKCEQCGNEFLIPWNRREVSLCSKRCVGFYTTQKYGENIFTKLRASFVERQKDKKFQQLTVFKDLEFSLKRSPLKKEWETECKKRGIPFRMKSTTKYNIDNKHVFKTYKNLKEEAEFFNHKVVSVNLLEEREDVYNITVDNNHTLATVLNEKDGACDGVFTFQCGEVALRNNQFCNLVTINVSDIQDQFDLNARVKAAAFIGTLQAGYTDFHYLRDIWKKQTEKDALLGISMTGIASNRLKGLPLKQAVATAREENERVAKLIHIKSAARLTCVKPEGSSSLVLGTSSGIHAWYNDYFIRRLRVNKDEPVYSYLKEKLPELIEDDFEKPHSGAIISIPIKAPAGAVLRNESALSLLKRVKFINRHWIFPGHERGNNRHNASATVFLKEHEWDRAAEWMWTNKEYFNGLTVLPYDGGDYVQMPLEDITEEKYEELVQFIKQIDLSEIKEDDDNTKIIETLACSGGSCEIKNL